MASCSATFCARPGTLTRTSAGIGAAKADSSWDSAETSCTDSPNPARDRADVAGGRCAKEPFEHSRLDRCRLGQEREDPSPTVVEHNEGAVGFRKVHQSRDVVQEGEVAQERHGAGALVGPAARGCHPQRSRHHAVDPVHAPIGENARRRRVRFGVPLEVPDRHGGRHHQGRTGLRRVAVDHAGHEWLAQVRPQGVGDGALRLSLALVPRVEPVGIRRYCRRVGGGDPLVQVAVVELGRNPQRISPAPEGIDDNNPGTGGGRVRNEGPEGPGEPGRAEQHDAVGKWRLRADDGVGGCDRPLQPASREGVGQDGPTQASGERTQAGGVRPLRPRASGNDHPPPPEGFDVAATGPVRPQVPAATDHLRAVAHRKRAGRPGQWLAELQIEVHRAGTVLPVQCLFEGPDRERPPGVLLTFGCDTWRVRTNASPRRTGRSAQSTGVHRCDAARAACPPCRR